MTYIVYDLEFNQKYSNSSNDKTISELPFEIIQIGALKLNENFETISTFNELIKPKVYTTIHPYVESLTNITIDKLSSSELFTTVYHNFINFIGNSDVTLCVWGKADIKELIRNVKFNNLSTSFIPLKYIDVQKHASTYFNVPKGSKIGLKTAVELLNINFENRFHDAFYDAFYTTEVYKKIYNTNINPKIYTTNNAKRLSKSKNKVNTTALVNQFEKMYNRKMSDEEKSIIKLAYIMGRTNQFVH
ncbi:exonuclease domain-containing protein [Clostridium sp. MSJ-4]|uniref:Exonuclease domain-containing protein n=1 Tax=Clostridium simiarum TaxID=2841506 RepID=A0ABS6F067_9CLOT|nr:3'-5' exonuclease [Clostridium simiarum]MBU5591868.1 exonuclease domain-containing protein [Clostridium simiarum]